MDEVVAALPNDAFRGRRVLVTGDTGFKGSWLCLLLRRLGAEVCGIALPPVSQEDHFELLGLRKFITHFDVDIRESSRVQDTFQECKPEFVFHLAAQPIVRLSYEQPKSTFDTNVGGSVSVLEAVRSTPSVRVLVYVTSDKCYRNKEWSWGYRENDELGGHDPYSASKAAAEIVFSAYWDSYFSARPGFGAGSVRAGNVIGGGDWSKDRIVPDAIRSLRNQEAVRIRNPWATRPWQHVLDPLTGYLTLAARLSGDPKKYSGAWNFGPRSESIRTVKELTQRIIEHWGSGVLETGEKDPGLHEAMLLQLNCDKANLHLPWTPRWDFERAVKQTVAWYKSVAEGGDAMSVSTRQIEEFSEGQR